MVRDVREGAATALRPVEGAIGTITSPVRNAWHGITDYDDLKGENDRLRAELAEVEAAEIGASDAEHQLADLSDVARPALRRRRAEGDGPGGVGAPLELLARPRDRQGQRRRAGGGHAGGHRGRPGGAHHPGHRRLRATVELITDPEFRVGVRLSTTGELGTAEGQGRDQPLKVDSSIAPDSEVAEGTGVVTSGVDRSAFPPGIPVGTVSSARQGSGGLALELVVEPLVEADQFSYVTVLQWQPG